jgi:hypothetical protein
MGPRLGVIVEVSAPMATPRNRPCSVRVPSNSGGTGMDETTTICPKCGLPIGRGPVNGPLWTPEIKGVEVCGCPPEEAQQRQHADELLHELDEMQQELKHLKHEG